MGRQDLDAGQIYGESDQCAGCGRARPVSARKCIYAGGRQNFLFRFRRVLLISLNKFPRKAHRPRRLSSHLIETCPGRERQRKIGPLGACPV